MSKDKTYYKVKSQNGLLVIDSNKPTKLVKKYDEKTDTEITIKVEPRTDCPFNAPLHYHHDGCPACIEQDWQDHWENIADNNPDDGSWVGR